MNSEDLLALPTERLGHRSLPSLPGFPAGLSRPLPRPLRPQSEHPFVFAPYRAGAQKANTCSKKAP